MKRKNPRERMTSFNNSAFKNNLRDLFMKYILRIVDYTNLGFGYLSLQ